MSIRPVWAEVDCSAIRDNAAALCALVGPRTEVCAVVKAFAYGHGPVRAAQAAIEGGATWLGVALVEEGEAVRRGGIEAPILVLSEPRGTAMRRVVGSDLRPAIYTMAGVRAAAAAVEDLGQILPVHLKVDTGMHRVGASPEHALDVARAIAAEPGLELEGVWTHFAVADEVARRSFTDGQAERLHEVVAALAGEGIVPKMVHAANSAATLGHPSARLDLVRCGIALYGIAPSLELAPHALAAGLRPALSLKAEVSFSKVVEAGEAMSYGLAYTAPERTTIATVPIGYADGVPRRLGTNGGEVLVAGQRRPVAGAVTMDQLLVDCGPGAEVGPGDEVVLIGRQGAHEITAWEWAERTGTIAYEVVCGLSARVPRVFV